jgi:prephenate dehydrogenase
MALRSRGLAYVVGVGRSENTLAKAAELGAIDRGETDLSAGVQSADIVVLATPVAHIVQTLPQLTTLLQSRPHTVVTDVGSTKAAIVQAGEAALGERFVGSHPMAGSERAGVEFARPDLFSGATWAITPTKLTDGHAQQRVQTLAQSVGAKTMQLSPEEHDQTVAVTSHLPHVLAYALSAVGRDVSKTHPHLFDLAAGSWASGTRVAHSSPELWGQIALSNREALLNALQEFTVELAAVQTALAENDADALLQAFTRGHISGSDER